MVISAIDDIILESEQSVIQAMFDACDKAWMILENYEGDDFSAFSIFQEAAGENGDKNTKKRGIISRILGIIPSMFRMFKQKREKRRKNRTIRRLKKAFGEKKKTLRNVSDETFMILNAIERGSTMNAKEMRKIRRQEAIRGWLIRTGVKTGMGVLLFGGTVYYLNEKNQLIHETLDNFKTKAKQKFDDEYMTKIREAGEKASKAVADAADAATKKMMDAVEKMKNAIIEIISKITKLYRSIAKRFKGVDSWDDVATDVKCSYNTDEHVLEITFDFEAWIEWVNLASKFIFNAEAFMKDRINKTTESGFSGKGTQERVKLVSDFNRAFNDIKRKTDKINKYDLNQVYNHINTLHSKFDDLEKHADDVQKVYENIKQKVEADNVDTKKLDFVYAVLNTVRGIMETIDDVDSTCNAISVYLEAFADITSGGTDSDTKDTE